MSGAKENAAHLDSKILSGHLDLVLERFVHSGEIRNDPAHKIMTFPSKADREVLALITAVFSYGRVSQILASLDIIFDILGPTPAATLKNSDGFYWIRKIPTNFRHRFNTASDLGILFTKIGEILRSHDSLENFFIADAKTDISSMLESFVDRFNNQTCTPYPAELTRGLKFLLPKPSRKSACKRLLLFLRWVVGTGPMDIGVWTKVSKSTLLIPVDTHVLRISKNLGLTSRSDSSWRTAQEITDQLKALDPTDPTKYDFAICHIGISQQCPSRFNRHICKSCEINTLCVTYKKAKK